MIKELETEAKNIGTELLAVTTETITFPFGTFSVSAKKKYQYPTEIESAREALKIAEIDAQESGDAVAVDGEKFITFKAAKF